jgi:hypothetical protein
MGEPNALNGQMHNAYLEQSTEGTPTGKIRLNIQETRNPVPRKLG